MHKLIESLFKVNVNLIFETDISQENRRDITAKILATENFVIKEKEEGYLHNFFLTDFDKEYIVERLTRYKYLNEHFLFSETNIVITDSEKESSNKNTFYINFSEFKTSRYLEYLKTIHDQPRNIKSEKWGLSTLTSLIISNENIDKSKADYLFLQNKYSDAAKIYSTYRREDDFSNYCLEMYIYCRLLDGKGLNSTVYMLIEKYFSNSFHHHRLVLILLLTSNHYLCFKFSRTLGLQYLRFIDFEISKNFLLKQIFFRKGLALFYSSVRFFKENNFLIFQDFDLISKNMKYSDKYSRFVADFIIYDLKRDSTSENSSCYLKMVSNGVENVGVFKIHNERLNMALKVDEDCVILSVNDSLIISYESFDDLPIAILKNDVLNSESYSKNEDDMFFDVQDSHHIKHFLLDSIDFSIHTLNTNFFDDLEVCRTTRHQNKNISYIVKKADENSMNRVKNLKGKRKYVKQINIYRNGGYYLLFGTHRIFRKRFEISDKELICPNIETTLKFYQYLYSHEDDKKDTMDEGKNTYSLQYYDRQGILNICSHLRNCAVDFLVNQKIIFCPAFNITATRISCLFDFIVYEITNLTDYPLDLTNKNICFSIKTKKTGDLKVCFSGCLNFIKTEILGITKLFDEVYGDEKVIDKNGPFSIDFPTENNSRLSKDELRIMKGETKLFLKGVKPESIYLDLVKDSGTKKFIVKEDRINIKKYMQMRSDVDIFITTSNVLKRNIHTKIYILVSNMSDNNILCKIESPKVEIYSEDKVLDVICGKLCAFEVRCVFKKTGIITKDDFYVHIVDVNDGYKSFNIFVDLKVV